MSTNRRDAILDGFYASSAVPAEHGFRLDQQRGQGGPWESAPAGEDEPIGLPPADHLSVAPEDADLAAQHQQLSLISGAVAEGCESEVDEESEAGVQDEQSMDGG